MIEGRTFIIFGDDWGMYVSTIQHIGKILAEKNRIIWIGSIGLRKPQLSVYDITRVVKKIGKMLSRRQEEINTDRNVLQLFPKIIPYHDIKALYRYNMRNIVSDLLQTIEKECIVDPIIITANPIVHDVIGKLGERSSYYLCLDDWLKFDGAFDCIGDLEQELLKKVTASFSISETLLRTRVASSGRNYFLAQGVDIDHFAQSVVPSNWKPIAAPKPYIGFFGILASWVDVELIARCAHRYPEYSFIVIGKQTTDISFFQRYSNIIYLGEVPYRSLPAYASHFDVGLIPFKVNELTIAANPIKLMEYLALGLPVVSTNLPEVKKHDDLVLVAKDADEFISFIPEAVKRNSAADVMERKRRAEQHSWRAITENICEVILKCESIAVS